jgi:hypothetical protein
MLLFQIKWSHSTHGVALILHEMLVLYSVHKTLFANCMDTLLELENCGFLVAVVVAFCQFQLGILGIFIETLFNHYTAHVNRGSFPTERREVYVSIILKMAIHNFLVRTDFKIPNSDLDELNSKYCQCFKNNWRTPEMHKLMKRRNIPYNSSIFLLLYKFFRALGDQKK